MRWSVRESKIVFHLTPNIVNEGNWCEFLNIMGGGRAPRKLQPIATAKVWSDKAGRYGEPVGNKVFGVKCGQETVTTRPHEWILKKKGP